MVMFGLSAEKYNGLEGDVEGPLTAEGRHVVRVRLADGETTQAIKVRPRNLRRRRADDHDDPGGSGGGSGGGVMSPAVLAAMMYAQRSDPPSSSGATAQQEQHPQQQQEQRAKAGSTKAALCGMAEAAEGGSMKGNLKGSLKGNLEGEALSDWVAASKGAATASKDAAYSSSFVGELIADGKLRQSEVDAIWAKAVGSGATEADVAAFELFWRAVDSLFDTALTSKEIRRWLKKHGFAPGDLRSEVQIRNVDLGNMSQSPMAKACSLGDLKVCQWLYENGAAEDVTKANKGEFNEEGFTPMLWACRGGHLSVCKWLYKSGAAAHISKAGCDGYHGSPSERALLPIFVACRRGHLSVCKWLLKMGAVTDVSKAVGKGSSLMHTACAAGQLHVCKWLLKLGTTVDVTKANDLGETPMFSATGNLSVCKWLYEVGAAADVTKANNTGETPMQTACQGDNLSVCKWLYEVGAAADITKAETKYGYTPMICATENGYLRICQWLCEVGTAEEVRAMVSAATLPDELYGYSPDELYGSTGHTPFLIASWEGHFSICQLLASHGALTDPATGHVSQAMVNRETRKCSDLPGLLEHMETALATHHTFLHVVLRASIILPAAAVNQQQQQQEKLEGGRGGDTSTSSADPTTSGPCLLPLLPREILKRVGSWLGVEVQRGLRNVQELVEALAVVEPAADSADEEEDEDEDEDEEEDGDWEEEFQDGIHAMLAQFLPGFPDLSAPPDLGGGGAAGT